MGSLFSNLTHTGVQQPNGQTSFQNNPAATGQALALASAATAQPNTSNVDGTLNPDTYTQEVAGGPLTKQSSDNTTVTQNAPPVTAQPRVVTPSFGQANDGGTNPFSSALTTKGKVLSGLLVAMQGAARGAAASVPTNPHISPGIGPALAAGVETPFAMKQQQNELEKEGAQNKLIAAQSAMVPTPYGQMPEGMAKLMFPAMIKAGATTDAAKIGAGSRENVANTAASSRETVAQTNKRFMAVPGVGLLDTQDPSGKPTLVPGSQEGITLTQQHLDDYGLPKEFLGKTMTISQLSGLERGQAARAGTTTNTVEYKDDGQGNIVALPKTTTTNKNLPGSPAASVKPAVGATSPGSPKVVISGKSVPMSFGTDSDGNQVAGTPAELKAAGVSNYSPLGADGTAKVNIARQLISPTGLFALAQKDLDKFKPGELEGLAPRWNEFLAGKVGTDDPRYVALRTHVNGLLSTALMQAHMGARGGESIMEHFQDMANAGKMSKDTLQSALGAEKEYVQDKAMRPKVKQAGAAPPPTGMAVSLSAARQLPQNNGKTDDQIKADIVKYGHAVTP